MEKSLCAITSTLLCKPEQKSSIYLLQAAAHHLERTIAAFRGESRKNVDSRCLDLNNKEIFLHLNPSKIVRRWLDASSNVSRSATLKDLYRSVIALFDPEGRCASGRKLLHDISSSVAADPNMNDDECVTDVDTNIYHSTIENDKYLIASDFVVEAWFISIAVHILIRKSNKTMAAEITEKGLEIIDIHIHETKNIFEKSFLSFGLYPLIARFYRLSSLCHNHTMPDLKRAEILKAHRISCLRKDADTQATLLNLLLRDFLMANQVDQAQKLLSGSSFPESASNNQLCRYHYYSGRIQALRLEYTSSFSSLSQCLRNTPTNLGLGFRIATHCLLIIVQLLMGEIPDRSFFFTKGMVDELTPYLEITQAVRKGDLVMFNSIIEKFTLSFKKDGTYSLISRLGHSVVNAGLHRLNISYSRISMSDAANHLGLPNASSAEFVVAKAIRDGVLDAIIYHLHGEGGSYLQSHDNTKIYSTTEPYEAFRKRIAYCLSTHNDVLRGMKFSPDAYKNKLDLCRISLDKNGDKTNEEKVQEIEEEMGEDF